MLFHALFSVHYMQDFLLSSNILELFFNTELIFAQDEDVPVRHPSLRAGASKKLAVSLL